MSIKFKILTITLIGLLFSSSVLSLMSILKAEKSLEESYFQKLDAIKFSKKNHIEDYLRSVASLLVSQAKSRLVIDALSDFSDSFYKVSNEIDIDSQKIKQELVRNYDKEYLGNVVYDLPNVSPRRDTLAYLPKDQNALIAQYFFIVDNPSPLGEKNALLTPSGAVATYFSDHEKYHPSFNKLLEEFSLYDIFLVDKKGNLVYTTFKEKDYATNLEDGPYKDTGIAMAYSKAKSLKEGEVVFDDFMFYEPSYNAPASFVATPIYKDDKYLGVLIFQMPIDRINEIMSFGGKYKESGLGDSGESYLVGSDFKMKNSSRFIESIDDVFVKKLGTTIGIFEVKSKSAQNALNGESGVEIIKNYRGEETLSSYAPIEIFGDRWAIVTEIAASEAYASSRELIRELIFVMAIITLLVLAGMFVGITIFMSKPLNMLIKTTGDLTGGEGDLTKRMGCDKKNEIGLASKNINAFISTIQELVNTAKKQSAENSSVVSELSKTSQAVAKNTEESSRVVLETTSMAKTVLSTIEESIKEAIESNAEIKTANTDLQSAKGEILALADRVNDTVTIETALSERISSLSQNAGQVNNVLKVIADIAEQTSLLALNATIEAARAGEHGRGFAVVADEVRKLAEKTQKSLSEISATINTLMGQIRESAEAMSINSKEIETLSDMAQQSVEKIEHTVRVMEKATELNAKTVNNYTKTGEKIDDISRKITQITDYSQASSKNVDEITVAINHMMQMTSTLSAMLNHFKS